MNMDKKKSVDRKEFELFFKNLNASWGFEGAELSEYEKELLYKRITGEISKEELIEMVLSKK